MLMEAEARQGAMKSMFRAWRLTVRAAVLVGASLAAGAAFAWSNHALLTWTALSALPEMTGRTPVRVESLAGFLAADPAGLAEVLRAEEAWARANVPAYPPRPDALAFRPEASSPAERVPRFLTALRVNPAARLALYLQLRPAGRRTAGDPLPSPRSR